MLCFLEGPAKEEGRGRANRLYSPARMRAKQKGATANPRAAITPHACIVAATGKQAASSSFSKANTTTGYCSCTHLNCSVAHTPAQTAWVQHVVYACYPDQHCARQRPVPPQACTRALCDKERGLEYSMVNGGPKLYEPKGNSAYLPLSNIAGALWALRFQHVAPCGHDSLGIAAKGDYNADTLQHHIHCSLLGYDRVLSVLVCNQHAAMNTSCMQLRLVCKLVAFCIRSTASK